MLPISSTLRRCGVDGGRVGRGEAASRSRGVSPKTSGPREHLVFLTAAPSVFRPRAARESSPGAQRLPTLIAQQPRAPSAMATEQSDGSVYRLVADDAQRRVHGLLTSYHTCGAVAAAQRTPTTPSIIDPARGLGGVRSGLYRTRPARLANTRCSRDERARSRREGGAVLGGLSRHAVNSTFQSAELLNAFERCRRPS